MCVEFKLTCTIMHYTLRGRNNTVVCSCMYVCCIHMHTLSVALNLLQILMSALVILMGVNTTVVTLLVVLSALAMPDMS